MVLGVKFLRKKLQWFYFKISEYFGKMLRYERITFKCFHELTLISSFPSTRMHLYDQFLIWRKIVWRPLWLYTNSSSAKAYCLNLDLTRWIWHKGKVPLGFRYGRHHTSLRCDMRPTCPKVEWSSHASRSPFEFELNTIFYNWSQWNRHYHCQF